MNGYQRWTQSDVTDLRQRLRDGATRADIAAGMGRTTEDVASMMRRLRLREV